MSARTREPDPRGPRIKRAQAAVDRERAIYELLDVADAAVDALPHRGLARRNLRVAIALFRRSDEFLEEVRES